MTSSLAGLRPRATKRHLCDALLGVAEPSSQAGSVGITAFPTSHHSLSDVNIAGLIYEQHMCRNILVRLLLLDT